jgi:cell division protein FtsB
LTIHKPPTEKTLNQSPQQPKPGFGDFALDAISAQRNQAAHAHAMAAAKAAELAQENAELKERNAQLVARIAELEKPKAETPDTDAKPAKTATR